MATNDSTRSGKLPSGTAPGVWGRLRIYLIGVGIGVMMLGMFALLKRQANQGQSPPVAGQHTPSP